MDITELDNWARLLLDPGQDGKDSTGLDARLLRTLIQGGQCPAGVLDEVIQWPVDQLPLPGRMRSTIRERAGLGGMGDGRGMVTLPVWAAWILMRGQCEPTRKMEAIGLLHEFGIVPWSRPVFNDLGVDIRGMDLLNDVRDQNIQREGEQAPVLRLAMSALPQAEIALLEQRVMGPRIQGWEVSARTSMDVHEIKVLAEHGLSGLKGEGNVYASGGRRMGEVMEAKTKAGGRPEQARRYMLVVGDTVEARIQRMEYLDKQYTPNGPDYSFTYADHIINTLAAGSMSVAKYLDILRRAGETQTWPVHNSGQGVGYTLLAIATDKIRPDGKCVVGKLTQAVESQMTSGAWITGMTQEAAGLARSGVSEWQCVKLARLLSNNSKNDDWKMGELGAVLFGLSTQKEIDITPQDITWRVGSNEREWVEWARQPNVKDLPFRQEIAISQDDQWQLDRLLTQNAQNLDALSLLDANEVLGRAVIARHSLELAKKTNATSFTDLEDACVTTWALLIIHGALSGAKGVISSRHLDQELFEEAIDPSFMTSDVLARWKNKIEGVRQLLGKPVLEGRFQNENEEKKSVWAYAMDEKDGEVSSLALMAKSSLLQACLSPSTDLLPERNSPKL